MNLFNCVRTIEPGSTNHRRDIYDFLDEEFPNTAYVKVFRFKTTELPNVGGNHWHKDDERFFIAAGEMTTLILEDVDTKLRCIWHHLGPGTLITIPGRIAHANILREDLILVGALRNGLDLNDVHYYPLLDTLGKEIKTA